MRRYNLPGDRALLKNLLAEIPPVSLTYGGRRMALAELSPQIEREALDEARTRTLFSAALDKHMTLRVERVDLRDAFNMNLVWAHVFAERETGEDAAFSRRVDTLDVRGRVRLGIAQTLGVCKRVSIALTVL